MSHQVGVLELSPQAVRNAMLNRQILLVDVREPQEYAAERIHGALLFPLTTFDAACLPEDSERQLVFHCAGGVRSLNAATRRLVACGKATHMKGGLAAWKAAGLPTVRVDPATGQVIDVGQ